MRALLMGIVLLVPSVAIGQELPERFRGLKTGPAWKLESILGYPEMTLGPAQYQGKMGIFVHSSELTSDAFDDALLCLCELEDGNVIREIKIPKAVVGAIHLAEDGKTALVALAMQDKKAVVHQLALFDVIKGVELARMGPIAKPILSVALSPDGKRALAGTTEGDVHLWDVGTGKKLWEKGAQNQPCAFVAFHENNQATVGRGTSWKILDLNGAREVADFAKHIDDVMQVIVSADGKIAWSTALDGQLIRWDLATGKEQVLDKIDGINYITLALSPDGKRLASVSANIDDSEPRGSVRLFDAESGKKLWTESAPLRGIVPAKFTQLGLLIGGGPNPWMLYDLAKGNAATWGGHKSAVIGVGVNKEGTVVSLGQDGQSRFWSENGRPSPFLRTPHALLAAAEQHPTLILADEGRNLIVWNPADKGAQKIVQKIGTGHDQSISSLAVSRDAKIAVTGGRDRTTRLWDLADGKMLALYRGHSEDVNAVALSPDGMTAFSASDDGTVRVWPRNAKEDDDPIVFEGHKRPVLSLAVSPDGKLLASGGQDQTIKIWDLQKNKLVRTLKGHKNWVTGLAFVGADRLVSTSDDLTIALWDVTKETPLERLDLGPVGDCPKCLTVRGRNVWIGTTGWAILKLAVR